ncbi:hypothetical protein A28LD_2317 [Idiomarina sp. A28L]|uniref:hypothetical protein n=1 Tax=Idiomarina sp. A28L TaxID=1036674 RepID=UPI00021385F8|nr:hypothetical protein [Idiomarina sp. A28L]EGN74177.1 hypothetical protein A28LD_2317 [Idiomarina sp. A28L]
MMNHNHTRHLAHTIELRSDAREFAGALAKNLMVSLHVIPGGDLVPHLGCGTEEDNLEAIESWVYMVCTCLKLPFSSDQLPFLENMLEPVLFALEEQLGYRLRRRVQYVG